MDRQLEKDLAGFKRHRDAMINGDQDNLELHVAESQREIRRNPLVKRIVSALPSFDVDAWWAPYVKLHKRTRKLERVDFPDDEDERLVVLLDLLDAFASGHEAGKISIGGFGQLFGRYKRDQSSALVMDYVLRPLADLLTDRVREAADVANPAIRELAGVPLDRIPNDDASVFLSHKSEDKPLVRAYYELLSELGLSPWLDERDMKAGDVLDHGIRAGLNRACAVVFFITKNFKDEQWLRDEVEQALSRKEERGDRFSIVTMVFDEEATVPEPLKKFLFVLVGNPVDAARQLVRALPIEVGPPRWRR